MVPIRGPEDETSKPTGKVIKMRQARLNWLSGRAPNQRSRHYLHHHQNVLPLTAPRPREGNYQYMAKPISCDTQPNNG